MTDGITKESFIRLPDTNKLDILFDYSIETHVRLTQLEKRKNYDTFFSSLAGFFAAITVITGKLLIWKK
jgi:quinol-cytochrome oxidoreductase complex cytochrome b subunit